MLACCSCSALAREAGAARPRARRCVPALLARVLDSSRPRPGLPAAGAARLRARRRVPAAAGAAHPRRVARGSGAGRRCPRGGALGGRCTGGTGADEVRGGRNVGGGDGARRGLEGEGEGGRGRRRSLGPEPEEVREADR